VESPQFHASFEYAYSLGSGVVQVGSADNVFVEKCLGLTLAFVEEKLGQADFTARINEIKAMSGCLGIKLRADNDFYSQIDELKRRNLPLLSSSLSSLPAFMPCPLDAASGKPIVNKTGMGSSAALTTSLVGALLQFFGVVQLGTTTLSAEQCDTKATRKSLSPGWSPPRESPNKSRKAEVNGNNSEDRRIVHNLSQLAHAIAQGKIGSGFDVAAAVYGTQIYMRFSPDGFKACMEPDASSKVIFNSVMDESLWSQTILAPFLLPGSMDIVMGDVCGGSSSSSMAREVLKWRGDKPVEAGLLWSELANVNSQIHETMASLSALEARKPPAFQSVMAQAATLHSHEWESKLLAKGATSDVITLLIALRDKFQRARYLLKSMGEQAGVGIEPDSQTCLANATEAIPGVLCAGVPGAGGVDAVFAITLSTSARDAVENAWACWKDPHAAEGSSQQVCPLVLRAEKGQSSGVRIEGNMTWE